VPKSRKLFVNLPVANLPRAIAFFKELGFEFNPKFTDDKGACMVLSDEGFVMLLQRDFFQTFTRRKPCDTATHTEVLTCISCDSRQEVDHLVQVAIASGGAAAMEAQDHGFMYGSSFYDPDGHHWEVMWMDPQGPC